MIDVLTIANVVCNSMSLRDVKIKTTGGVDGGRGWKGDVKIMHLDITKLKKLGWIPKLSSNLAVKKASNELLQ